MPSKPLQWHVSFAVGHVAVGSELPGPADGVAAWTKGRAMGPLGGVGVGRHDEPPTRETVREITSRLLRDPPAKSILEQRLEFEARHPEVTLKPPWTTRSGLWEADWQGNTSPIGHDTCEGLLGYLRKVFQDEEGPISG